MLMKWLNIKHSRSLNNAANVNENIIFCGEMYQWEVLIQSAFLGDRYKFQVLSDSIQSQSLLRNILPAYFITVTK